MSDDRGRMESSRWNEPVDLNDEGEHSTTVRRSDRGFSEPVPFPPQRAQDGDMGIPELGLVDPRFQEQVTRIVKQVIGQDEMGPTEEEGERLDPWDAFETSARNALVSELETATDAADRAEKWAAKLATVDGEIRNELAGLVGSLRSLAAAVAGRYPAHRSPRRGQTDE